jgi:hypothetical protein
MKNFGLKSVSSDKSLDDLFFFDLRDESFPPMKLITFKAKNKKDAFNKLQNVEFCISIGLEDWLFEPYRLVQL